MKEDWNANWLMRFYFWLWHDLLKLHEPISWIIVHSMRNHMLAWDLIGAIVVSSLWVLLIHLIALL